ncbi:hypothetical protein F2Q70_00018959 [Brassica cretica]|uniref:3'(2'),5'-bisphosphate nucleotidase n=1 Tax=Brassica cretica TaxID=69181 RepID=A0A8S9HVY5_BRACR|nr:hypothetical protein F2Q70_00018959 [Brassica cretica]
MPTFYNSGNKANVLLGSQAVVSLVLERELKNEPVSLVAEAQMQQQKKEIYFRLVKDTLATDDSYASASICLLMMCSRPFPKEQYIVTKFIRGEQYAIGLALLVEGKVVLAVMACPKLPLASTAVTNNTHKSSPNKIGCLFFGSAGTGTYVQSLNVVDSSPVKSEFESVCAVTEAGDVAPRRIRGQIQLGIKESPIKINSQTKYAGLSRGDGEVYLRFTRKPRPESIWNHAAGSILVSEAGGKVTDAEGNPLDFSKGKYLDYKRGIVVITQKLIAKAFESGKRIH